MQKDASIGDKLGEYWKELTNGKGSHFNCNRQKYKHKGVGIIHHNDTQKRKILDEYVTSYLCKDDKQQDLATVKNNSKDRAFTRGTLPRSKGNKGRPRKI